MLPYTIDQNNTYYCLNESAYIEGQTTITFSSNVQNSTLDCLNHNLEGNRTSGTYGVYITGTNARNNTIINCNITHFYNGIYLFYTNNHTIINNLISNNQGSPCASGNYWGIRLRDSENNSIINNTIFSNGEVPPCSHGGSGGIKLDEGSSGNQIINNNVSFNTQGTGINLDLQSGGTLINNNVNSNWIGISLGSQEYSSNKIIGGFVKNNGLKDLNLGTVKNTNFSMVGGLEKIEFYDTCAYDNWFNYNDATENEIWLKTCVNTFSITITRKLISWTQSLMQWNDSAFSSVTARYNINGLNPNKYYNIYDNSVLAYTLQTDSDGILPTFTIYLSSEHEIKVQETVPPTTKLVHAEGTALYYYTGEKVNGKVTAIPLENPENKTSAIFTEGEWSMNFDMIVKDVEYLTFIIDGNGKIGYSQVKLDNDNPKKITDCVVQNISLSGNAVDINTGKQINSGNVRLSVIDTVYTNITSFSGSWNIDLHPCLISGKIYTLHILISDNSGKTGEMFENYPAK